MVARALLYSCKGVLGGCQSNDVVAKVFEVVVKAPVYFKQNRRMN